MENNIPPRVPKRKSTARNGAVIGITAAIGISAVVLSGVAGYAGASYAIDQKQSGSVTAPITDKTSSSLDGNTSVKILDISDIVAKLKPSVVEISTESVSSGNSIFGQYVSQGAGSGVILSADGYIVTNNHVVNGANSIKVKTYDGQEYEATLVGTDPQTDVAVIKVDATDLSPATIGSSDDIQVGEAAIAIGNPLGSLGGTVTTGIISAVGREITIDNETMTLLQTDAAINPGNSGGGLFDVNGELIGIVNAKQSDTGIEGLGFAIPISDVTSVIDDLVAHGQVTTRPVLNVSLQQVQNSTYYGQNRTMEPGVYIVQIVEGGTADLAGLQMGDRIVSFDGQEISSSAEVKNILKKHAVGDVVQMVVDRNGEQVELDITLHGSEAE